MEKARILLVCSIILIVWSCTSAATTRNIFLLGGQSNMAGRGGVYIDSTGRIVWDGVIPPECGLDPCIEQLAANLTWLEACEPLHREMDPNRTNGVGPGMPFAHRLLDARPNLGRIGLVPCAFGGSKIRDWQRGTLLYERMVTRATASINSSGKLQALLWFQGGADTERKEDADSYKRLLLNFFIDLRDDLYMQDLPILQVAIAPGKRPFSDEVREAQLSVQLPGVTTLDSKGLPVGPDGVHLTTESQVLLGNNLAHAFLKVCHVNS